MAQYSANRNMMQTSNSSSATRSSESSSYSSSVNRSSTSASNSRYNMFSTKTLHHIPAEPLDGVLHVGVCVRVVDRLVVGVGHHLTHDAVVIGSTCGLTQSYFPETARMTQKI